MILLLIVGHWFLLAACVCWVPECSTMRLMLVWCFQTHHRFRVNVTPTINLVGGTLERTNKFSPQKRVNFCSFVDDDFDTVN